jgi:hypothetical protein
MALRFLLDEHLRGPLWHAVQRHNLSGSDPIDAFRVGDPPDLPLGSDDSTVLAWAERADRILLTVDKNTIPGHLADYLQAASHSPGVFLITGNPPMSLIVAYLILVAQAGNPDDYRDQVTYVP